MIGKRLSHFRILEKIGEGGMGVVYRAEDEKLGRHVALKVLQPEMVGDEERRLRFLREARTAASVTHPNIATIHEIDEVDGVIFIAMELVEGETLRRALDGKPLPVRDVLRASIEIGEALTKAHGAGIVHRDLKPENIIVGPDHHVKILDFGLAKLYEEERPRYDSGQSTHLATISAEMTREGRVLGTASYMSPEQARGLAVDSRSDLFAYGVLMYEMATGSVPFKGPTITDTLSAILRDTAPPLTEKNPEMPPALDRIAARCLEKATDDRFQSAGEAVDDLRRLRRETDSQPIQHLSSGGIRPVRPRPSWLRPLPIALGVAILAIALLGIPRLLGMGVLGTPGTVSAKSLAVLPLVNLKDRGDPDRLGQILQELIITDLSEVDSLTVYSSQRLFDVRRQFEDGGDDATIGRELATKVADEVGAKTMLTGSLSKLGSNWILASQLVNVNDGEVLASARIDGHDLYAMVDELTGQIRADLGLGVVSAAELQLAVKDKTTSSINAYQYYLEGVERLNERDYRKAVLALHKAVEIDPTFGMALYKMAVAGWWFAPGRDWWEHSGIAQPEQLLEQLLSGDIKMSKKDRLLAEAMLPLVKRDFDDAVEPFERLVAQYPEEKEGWYGLGEAEFHSKGGSKDEALAAFEQTLSLDPSFGLVFTHVFDLYRAKRRYDDVIGLVERLIANDPENSPWYNEWVGSLIEKGDSEAAEAALEEALTKITDGEESRRLFHSLAGSYSRVGDEARTLESLNRALEADADSDESDVLNSLGWYYQQRNNFPEAERHFLRALNAEPTNERAQQGLWTVYDAERRYDDAARWARNLLRHEPEEKQPYGFLARALVARGDEEGIEELFRMAQEQGLSEEDLRQGFEGLSQAYAEVGDTTHRADYARQAYNLDPTDRGVAETLGWSLLANNDHESAAEIFEESVQADPMNGNACYGLVRALVAAGRIDEAVEVADRWEQNQESPWDWRLPYMLAYIHAGRLDEAEAKLQETLGWIQSDQQRARYLRAVAGSYVDAGYQEQAEQLLRRAVALSPDDLESLTDYGQLMILTQDYAGAEQAFRKALAITPRSFERQLSLAAVHLLRNENREAERIVSKLLEDGPQHRDALLALALAHAGRDDWSGAADLARRAQAMDPDRETHEILAWMLIAGDLDIDEGIRTAELAQTLPADPFRENSVLPIVPSAEHALGLAQLKRGEYSAAIETLEEAVELRPDRESIREDLSRARLGAAG